MRQSFTFVFCEVWCSILTDRKEGRKEGRNEGRKEERKEGRKKGRNEGRNERTYERTNERTNIKAKARNKRKTHCWTFKCNVIIFVHPLFTVCVPCVWHFLPVMMLHLFWKEDTAKRSRVSIRGGPYIFSSHIVWSPCKIWLLFLIVCARM